jgi:hypothetical protein
MQVTKVLFVGDNEATRVEVLGCLITGRVLTNPVPILGVEVAVYTKAPFIYNFWNVSANYANGRTGYYPATDLVVVLGGIDPSWLQEITTSLPHVPLLQLADQGGVVAITGVLDNLLP